MKEEKTVLVIVPGKQQTTDSAFYILVAETGEALASHYCSSAGFAFGDLYDHRPERKKEWGKRFGSVIVKYIDETDITEKQILERNRKWAEINNLTNDKLNR